MISLSAQTYCGEKYKDVEKMVHKAASGHTEKRTQKSGFVQNQMAGSRQSYTVVQ